jgi:hypothetical protein
MPDGILAITERAINVETPRRGVSTRSTWKPGTLGVIVNQFISNSIKRIRRAGTTTFAEFAVMPNHIHGIVIIVDINTSLVETLHATSLPSQTMLSEGQERSKLEAGSEQLTSIEDGNTVTVTRLRE